MLEVYGVREGLEDQNVEEEQTGVAQEMCRSCTGV